MRERIDLRAALRERGGTLAEALGPRGTATETEAAGPARWAAEGPRARGHEADYELLLEMILEGSRLHYGEPQAVRGADEDLSLLLGDQLYALGLARLAVLGDLTAVAELADVISLVAAAQVEEDDELAAAVWEAGAVAIGWGAGAAHAHAKAAAAAREPGAVDELRSGIPPEVRLGS